MVDRASLRLMCATLKRPVRIMSDRLAKDEARHHLALAAESLLDEVERLERQLAGKSD